MDNNSIENENKYFIKSCGTCKLTELSKFRSRLFAELKKAKEQYYEKLFLKYLKVLMKAGRKFKKIFKLVQFKYS